MNNWSQFIYCLSAGYFLYYLFNLAYDLSRGGRSGPASTGSSLMLNIADLDVPVDADLISVGTSPGREDLPEGLLSSGPISSTGGITLKEAMGDALKESILYSSQIPS
ncbi:hypothetical protein [Pedobacter psychrodurus]|uniref:hypothetical protein n=1 Tax=Pedobacter psychrodurus TaxID=2530456 RepID=UPI00292EE0F8|nr:hypothetical protein [Pedobacter psychrodurus]